MSTAAATKCNMCGTFDMVPAPGKDGSTKFMVCPNCDNPKGKMPPR